MLCCGAAGLVVLVDFFFNSLVVRVQCSLIFLRSWLFIDFRLVILLLVVRRSEGFLPTPPSWLELPNLSDSFVLNPYLLDLLNVGTHLVFHFRALVTDILPFSTKVKALGLPAAP